MSNGKPLLRSNSWDKFNILNSGSNLNEEKISENLSPEAEFLTEIACLNDNYNLVLDDAKFGNYIAVDGFIEGSKQKHNVRTNLSLHDDQIEFSTVVLSSNSIDKLVVLELILNAFLKGKFSLQSAGSGSVYVVLSTLLPRQWITEKPQRILHILNAHARAYAEVNDEFIPNFPELAKLASKGLSAVYEFIQSKKEN